MFDVGIIVACGFVGGGDMACTPAYVPHAFQVLRKAG